MSTTDKPMKIETAAFIKTPTEMKAIRLRQRFVAATTGIKCQDCLLKRQIDFIRKEAFRIRMEPESTPEVKAIGDMVEDLCLDLLEDENGGFLLS